MVAVRVLLFLIAFASAADLHLNGDTILKQVAAGESVMLNITTNQPYIYVSVEGCGSPAITMNQNGKQIPPQDTLPPTGFLFPTNLTAQLLINSSFIKKSTAVRLVGLEGERELPKNSWGIQTQIDDQYLRISFRSVKIYERHVNSTYSLWFSRTPSQMDCWMFSNSPPEGAAGYIETPYITTDSKDTVQVWVPINNAYPEVGENQYHKKEQILALINQFENFYVGVLAKVASPYQMGFVYSQIQVQHQLSLIDLEGGLAILLMGVLVFGIISVVYLFFKRKYKDEQSFQQQIEVEAESGDIEQPGNCQEIGVMKS